MTSQLPRVLLVEDDPVSRTFLAATVQALPADVDAADSVAAAAALAAANRYDVWLIDANLPDGSGIELLARLRGRDATTPALAHTAAFDIDATQPLLGAGFSEVLVKPMAAQALRRTLARVLRLPDPQAGQVPDLWDDDAAVQALNGNREHITALRRLFLAELPAVAERVENAFRNEDFQGLHAELHRLRASCGFVGATRLLDRVQSFAEADRSADCLREFSVAVQALLAAGEPVTG